ncbi:MAG: sodium:solute symporter [Bacteroidales bacterium]|nr:sodium:solute symporter [Bacteroidales bacterium]
MTPLLILLTFLCYTALLFVVAAITSRKAGNLAFFLGNRQSPWFVVAYGMIGASLSGVTFISIPGWVGDTQFSYMMVVAGYLIGYFLIATVLLPLYYRLQLTSIYTYLGQRLGRWSYHTGSFYFLLSRSIGAAFRMYLVVNVLQIFVFDGWGISFWLTAMLFIVLIMLYTFRGGIRTIVWTDTLQTTFMLAAVVITVFLMIREMDSSLGRTITDVMESGYSKILFLTEWRDERYFLKQFLSGAFIAIVMTGLDQDMMQKNLSCRSLKDARKNVITLSWILVPVNLLFLSLGAVLYLYARSSGIDLPAMTDDLFPMISLKYLGAFPGVVFIIGLIAAAYSSADSALTALTTSFSIDILGLDRRNLPERTSIRYRYLVHVGMALLLLLIMILFRMVNDQAVIAGLFTIAGYTYGPLLGLFTFGIFTRYRVRDRFVPLAAVAAPVMCLILDRFSEVLFNGYRFGFELLIVNGAITFLLLYLLRDGKSRSTERLNGTM